MHKEAGKAERQITISSSTQLVPKEVRVSLLKLSTARGLWSPETLGSGG